MIRRPLALTMGDPAGVGIEITLKAWKLHKEQSQSIPPFFIIADMDHLARTAQHLNLDVPMTAIDSPEQACGAFSKALPVLHQGLSIPVTYGAPDVAHATPVIDSIRTAVRLTLDKQASGVVTNPIAKNILYQAGFDFPGHTEFLAHLANEDCANEACHPVMMLACDKLRVVLATVHVSLSHAIRSLNTETICKVARITHHALVQDFAISNPTIAVAGLNPHAGENGAMGDEELTIIRPAIEQLQSEGLNVFGPLPPDTMFTEKALSTYDAALCMYHDQGLIPLKAIDFDHAVNITLGLAFVRTSPDHGTAFDIAGKGTASPSSLMSALSMAGKMADTRAKSLS